MVRNFSSPYLASSGMSHFRLAELTLLGNDYFCQMNVCVFDYRACECAGGTCLSSARMATGLGGQRLVKQAIWWSNSVSRYTLPNTSKNITLGSHPSSLQPGAHSSRPKGNLRGMRKSLLTPSLLNTPKHQGFPAPLKCGAGYLKSRPSEYWNSKFL